MTVGDLFSIIILILVVWFSLAYVLYRIEVKRLRGLGYRSPKRDACFSYWAFLSYFFLLIAGVGGFILYKIVINWNMPI